MAATERFPYDRGSKWLIEHHGDALLRLAGVRDITSWRPLQAEVVQPRQLPDGLLEVRRTGRDEPDLFVLELSTYPDRRVPEQLLGDAALVYLNRGTLPEVLVVVLHPKGNVQIAEQIDLRSPGGWTRWRASWRLVELWTLPAATALATGEPGLMPWVPLMQIDGPPEPVLQQCRTVIDQKARPDERDNLLAVTVVFAGLRYNDDQLLAILGGERTMIESPILQRFVAERMAQRMHKAILGILEDRFGPVPAEAEAALRTVTDDDRLQALNRLAARCPDLAAFRQELPG